MGPSGKVCAIIGFGPGLGAAYADTFKNAGYKLALLSRSGAGPEEQDVSKPEVKAFVCDAADF